MKITIRQLKQLIREQVEEAGYLDVNTGEFYGGSEEQVENKPAKTWKVVTIFSFANNRDINSYNNMTVNAVAEKLSNFMDNLREGDAEIGAGFELVTLENKDDTFVVVGADNERNARIAFRKMEL